MKKCFLHAIAVSVFAAAMAVPPATAYAAPKGPENAAQSVSTPLTLWYNKPATNWEREGLPIGNGAMGAVLMGGVQTDDIPFNEKTLWTGGPGAKEGYNGGLPPKGWTSRLQKVRDMLKNDGKLDPKKVAAILGHDEKGPGAYQSFGHLQLTFPGMPEKVEGYTRSLNLQDAVAQLRFWANGVRYTREYFASYPDHVIVIRLRASAMDKVTFTAKFSEPDNRTVHVTADKSGRLTVRGALKDNGEVYEAGLQVMHDGGTVEADGDHITVKGAYSAWLILSAGTNYAQHYPNYRGADPHAKITATLNAAMKKGWSKIFRDHDLDYSRLFSRVDLMLGGKMPVKPTDQLLADYKKDSSTPEARALESLYFQYGRYLLIASSRAGSLPPNLQGVWNPSENPPWADDYHVNINLQMNYWLADPANLAETMPPLFDFVDSMVKPGEVAAKRILGADGWTMFLKTNIWGQAGIISWPTAFWQPEGGAWMASQYYDHYRYTGDVKFLKRAWPVMQGAAEVWLETLIPDPRDGKLVVSPSYSPEHGPFSNGAAMSQQIVWGLFTDVAEAAKVLHHDAFRKKVLAAQAKMDPGLHVGSWGQLEEWHGDWDNPNDHHRHTSHLYALHPGRQISPRTTPEFAKAAEVSLKARGDSLTANGESGTGWSKAWKINFWARLYNGNHAYALLERLIRENAMDNLWNAYVTPPFQIDSNFGVTNGMIEMLLQSQMDEIDLLPALPSAWPDGAVLGLKARGDITVNMLWHDGRAQKVELIAGHDATIRVRSTLFAGKFTLVDAGGKKVQTTGSGDLRTFTVKKGGHYVLNAA